LRSEEEEDEAEFKQVGFLSFLLPPRDGKRSQGSEGVVGKDGNVLAQNSWA